MRLKQRLSYTLTLVTAGALGVSFFVAALLVRREETEDLDRAILAQATDSLAPSVIEGSGEIPELPMPVRRYEVIYDPRGSVVSSSYTFGDQVPAYGQLGLPNPIPTGGVKVELSVGDSRLRGVVLPFGEGGSYRLLYALTRRAVDDDLRFLVEVFVFLFLAATGLTALFSRWLGARLSSDVDAIADVARAVASGDLDARVQGRADGSSELRVLGADMDRMIGQLGSLMASQRTFISHAAHELRSPLATLRGELQLALRRPRTTDEYREAIEEALSEVGLLVALAEDLLVLARLQGGGLARDAETTPGDALRDAQRMARGPAEVREVRFEVAPSTDLDLPIRGARADIARAIRNILDNAVAHSPRGGVVQIHVARSPRHVALSVSDQGEGVPPQDAPHLFSPFFRGSKDQSGEQQGTGLGLAIVREIVRSVGGEVYLDPAPAGGARFILELPLVVSQSG